jgi:hypothetical protein
MLPIDLMVRYSRPAHEDQGVCGCGCGCVWGGGWGGCSVGWAVA